MRILSLLLGAILILLAGPALSAEPLPMGGHEKEAQPGLPLSKVVLYSSGVGYFQHEGTVQGHAQVDLRFKADNINDLLKSMIVQDLGGGQATTVRYDSRDPLAKTLRSFGIDLTGNPTLGQLLDQIRGERIEVFTPNPLAGIIVGVERKQEVRDEGKPSAIVQVEYLNLLTDAGFRSLPLSQAQSIRLVNNQLNGELQQALAVLATGHDTQKKTVSIAFDGEGKRTARVAYMIETPVWKTAYRLVLDDERRPFLQGWAIVENTTDHDWNSIRLSLVSGRPISFVMDLYQPLYAARPVVVPELYTSLRPQVYGEPMEEGKLAEAPEVAPGRADRAKEPRRALLKQEALAKAQGAVPGAPPAAAMDLTQGVAVTAMGHEAGELFEYTIGTPVTLGRQSSAMLPILGQEVEGQKVWIYNETVHPKYPLNGYRLKNSTPLHLMQGPMTVFDAGGYAGDARIEDLAPGQERLISYAMDLKTEVESLPGAGRQELLTVSLRKGTLLATLKAIEQRTYNVKNRDQKSKLVLIEHPFRSEWKLTEPSQPVERTREVYRFSVPVEVGKSATLQVREERQLQQTILLADVGSDLIAYYQQARETSPRVREALQRVSGMRDRISQASGRRSHLEQRVKEIAQEQGRIRENMTRLSQNSELYNRYVKKLDQQETEVEKLRKEIDNLQATEETLKRELNDYLMGLDID